MPEPESAPRLSRRALLGWTAGAGAAALVPARRSLAAPAPPSPVRGGFPLVALAAVPDTLDPARTTQRSAQHLTSLIYGSLLRPNTAGGVIPNVAIATLDSPDALSLTLFLRPGIVFHDGTPVRGRDVVASLARLGDKAISGKNAWRLEHVRQVVAPDDKRVLLTLSQPDISLPPSLSSACAAILPADAFDHGDPFAAGALPPGTGPFRFHLWASGGRLLLDRNPAFWRTPRPWFDGLLISYLPEEASRTTAMVTLAVDVIEDAPLLDIPTLKQDTRTTLVGGPSRRVCAIGLNLRRGQMRDIRLRRLVAAAIDRNSLVKAATGGEAIPSTTLFPADFWGALNESVPNGASGTVRQQLNALGYPAGLSLTLLCPEQDAPLANAAILLQEQFAQAGIAVTLQLLESPVLERTLADGDFDLALTWQGPWLDPHELVRPMLASDGVENITGYANSSLDRLIDQAIQPAAQDARAGLYQTIQETMLQDMPWIVLFHPNQYHACISRLLGMAAYVDGSLGGLAGAWFNDQSSSGTG